MTVAEYLAVFLRDNGITKVFAIQGGGSARLIDAIGFTDGIEYVCNQHEQASAMAADGYARATGEIGCALSTSGPGATNMLTGCCGAYFDSIPVLFITGQVSSFRLKGQTNVRCMHTQETEVVDIFRSVTKYATALKDPYDIRYELEKCLFLATDGRPGPVLIDIPDDFQRTKIDISKLRGFNKPNRNQSLNSLRDDALQVSALISEATKPVIIAGGGIHNAHAEREFVGFVETTNIPTVTTWAGNDILTDDCPLKVGTLGMNGSRVGNYAVKNADLLIVLGARLDQHTVIVSPLDFAKQARIVYVDIDCSEIAKFETKGRQLDIAVNADLRDFFHVMEDDVKLTACSISNWIDELQREKKNGSIALKQTKSIVNPKVFFDALSECLDERAMIFVDTGSSLVWTEQYLKVKNGQRVHSSLNNTPMGYALPASIGAAIATKDRVYSINGDGGLQMNIQELATIIRHNMDIKIILFDNGGYGMVQRTQDTYMGSRYEATDVRSGLAFPDFEKLFIAYGFKVYVINNNDDCIPKLKLALNETGPGCVIVKVLISEDYESFHAEDISK